MIPLRKLITDNEDYYTIYLLSLMNYMRLDNKISVSLANFIGRKLLVINIMDDDVNQIRIIKSIMENDKLK